MYKLGPIHQGAMERGAKTTSDSYILWPARVGAFSFGYLWGFLSADFLIFIPLIGAFSLVMGRHVNHADTSGIC